MQNLRLLYIEDIFSPRQWNGDRISSISASAGICTVPVYTFDLCKTVKKGSNIFRNAFNTSF